MKYNIYIKNNEANGAPDHEDSCEASSKKEAVEIFTGRLNNRGEDYWSPEFIAEFVAEEERQLTGNKREYFTCVKCGNPFLKVEELNPNGECLGCFQETMNSLPEI